MANELVLVVARNRPRVLPEVLTTLAHRQVGFSAMTVSIDEESDTLCVVLTVRLVTPADLEMLHKRLNRVVDVLKVVALTEEVAHHRAGLLVKVAANAANRGVLLDIVRAFGAELVEMSATTMTLALQSTPATIRSLQEVLTQHRILETVPLGSAGIARGARIVHDSRSRHAVVA